MQPIAPLCLALLCLNCIPDADAGDHRKTRRLPADFEPVDELLVTWDEGDDLEPTFAQLVAEASWSTRVVVVLDREQISDEVRDAVADAGGDIDALTMLSSNRDSLWLRDYGPLVVHDGARRMVYDFEYFGAELDDVQAKHIAKRRWNRSATELDIRLEGGNLISTGDGVCLTSDIVLSDNPRRSETSIRDLLARELGCQKLLILPRLEGEGTGHVDMFVTLVGRRQALVGRYSRRVDRVNALRLDAVARILSSSGFAVTRVPMPGHGDGVYRTYTNAVLANDVVLVPVYDTDVKDEKEALDIFAKAFPERRVVPIESSNLIELAGAIHCVTMSVAR